MRQLEPLMQQNFLEYASYVIVDRAIPDVRDGCKPVQRRILHILNQIDDGKFHKVANIIGEAMKLHPHGDVSIGDALVVLANKEYFIEKQGNFGNVITGHDAAASRYIECRLTPLARETLFNDSLTTFQKSYDGRRDEPVFLPVKLPVLLLLGTEGIAVGMATKILPHNFVEVLEAQIACLRGDKVKLLPDFIQGGAMDASEYADGAGKIKLRATLEAVGDKKVVVREVPYSTTTESLIASIEAAITKGKVKIASIDDFTTDKVEIELTLARGTYADEVIPQLYAYTDCEVSITSNVVLIHERHPKEMKIGAVVTLLTGLLKDQVKAELEHALEGLSEKLHWLTLEQIFIDQKIYKRIEGAESKEKVEAAVVTGMQPFVKSLVRALNDKDIERLLSIPIRRISVFDRGKNKADIDEVLRAQAAAQKKLKNLVKTTIGYLEDLIKRYGKLYPRKTSITRFVAIDRKAVARQNIRLTYERESGFFGIDAKGDEFVMSVSEYELILAINDKGGFRIMTPQSKVLVGNVLYLAVFEPSSPKSFSMVYRDSKKIAFAKRFTIAKFIRNREYKLIGDPMGKVDFLSDVAQAPKLRLRQAARARQKAVEFDVNLNELEPSSLTAKGIKLAPKPVTSVTVIKK